MHFDFAYLADLQAAKENFSEIGKADEGKPRRKKRREGAKSGKREEMISGGVAKYYSRALEVREISQWARTQVGGPAKNPGEGGISNQRRGQLRHPGDDDVLLQCLHRRQFLLFPQLFGRFFLGHNSYLLLSRFGRVNFTTEKFVARC